MGLWVRQPIFVNFGCYDWVDFTGSHRHVSSSGKRTFVNDRCWPTAEV